MPTRKILLVDDDLAFLDGVGDRLRSWGLNVRTAATATVCCQALREELPDLVLLDIRLPDGDGLDILRDIRKQHPDLPVVMSSSLRGKKEEALQAGARAFLAKPFGKEALRKEVFLALGERI